MKALRWAALAASTAGATVALALGLAVTVPTAAGYRSLNVLSGSMKPALAPGDVVLAEMIGPLEARPGDVLTFPHPNNRAKLITHRLRDLRVGDGMAHFVTQGDANDTPERWSVPLGDEIGRVVVRLPLLGYAREAAGGRAVRLGLLISLAGMTLWLLVELWLPRRRTDPREAEGGPGTGDQAPVAPPPPRLSHC